MYTAESFAEASAGALVWPAELAENTSSAAKICNIAFAILPSRLIFSGAESGRVGFDQPSTTAGGMILQFRLQFTSVLLLGETQSLAIENNLAVTLPDVSCPCAV